MDRCFLAIRNVSECIPHFWFKADGCAVAANSDIFADKA